MSSLPRPAGPIVRAVAPSLSALLAIAACADPAPWDAPLERDASASLRYYGAPGSDPYPVDPYVHVANDALDPLDPSTIDPTILSAVAYARYATEVVLRHRNPATEVDDIAWSLALSSWIGGAPPATAIAALEQSPTPAQTRAAWVAMVADARNVSPTGPIPRAVERLVAMRHSRDVCAPAASAAACCRALLAPAALLDEPTSWTPEQRDHVRELAARPDFAFRLVAERLAADPTQPFEHLGLRAWLGACGGEATGAPNDLAALVARYGDYRAWPSELHPISMAKLAGRRIYRRGRISIAESIDERCAVRETEVVIARPTGTLDFWTYDRAGHRSDTGLFPAGPGRDAVKLAPDACMGCHYKFDVRRFDVRVPSWAALQLELRYVRGVPSWRDDSVCALPGEPIKLHAPLPPTP